MRTALIKGSGVKVRVLEDNIIVKETQTGFDYINKIPITRKTWGALVITIPGESSFQLKEPEKIIYSKLSLGYPRPEKKGA